MTDEDITATMRRLTPIRAFHTWFDVSGLAREIGAEEPLVYQRLVYLESRETVVRKEFNGRTMWSLAA